MSTDPSPTLDGIADLLRQRDAAIDRALAEIAAQQRHLEHRRIIRRRSDNSPRSKLRRKLRRCGITGGDLDRAITAALRGSASIAIISDERTSE